MARHIHIHLHDDFEEEKHPRGQPDNPGQFAKKGSGGTRSPTAKKRLERTIRNYTRSSYESVNAELRGHATEGYTPPAKQINELTSFLNNERLPTDTVLYRQVDRKFLQQAIDKKEFVDPGFVSTSRLPGGVTAVIRPIKTDAAWVMKINAPKGARAADLAKLGTKPSEKEVLIQRGAKFKVRKVDAKNKQIEIDLVDTPEQSEKYQSKRPALHEVGPAKEHLKRKYGLDVPENEAVDLVKSISYAEANKNRSPLEKAAYEQFLNRLREQYS